MHLENTVLSDNLLQLLKTSYLKHLQMSNALLHAQHIWNTGKRKAEHPQTSC